MYISRGEEKLVKMEIGNLKRRELGVIGKIILK
jgi:hypothetical protein